MPVRHSPLYAALVAPHALAAGATLVAGAVALGTRKGGLAHARAGRAYWRATAGVVASGGALLLAGAWSLRLLVLFALTAQTTWSGVRVLRRRRPDLRAGDRARAKDWAVAVAAVAVGAGACATAAAGVDPGSAAAVWSTAPLLAAYAGYDLWRFARPAAWPMRPRLWLGEHVVKLTGAYFGAVSAASGSLLAGVPMPWRVVAPNVAGLGMTLWFLVRMQRRSTRHDAGALATA